MEHKRLCNFFSDFNLVNLHQKFIYGPQQYENRSPIRD